MAGANSCLGIFFNKDIVKYARLEKSNDGTISIKNHAVKFVKEQNISDAVFAAISEANAMDIPVVINAPGTKYSDFKVLKQISSIDRNNIIRLEFEEWCDKNVKSIDDFTYVQNVSDIIQEEHYSGVVAIASKEDIKKFQNIGPKSVNAMYPSELTIVSGDTVDDIDYILVDLDENLTITTVVNNKRAETLFYNIGMNQIIEAFVDLLGNYPKAYEACKQINVFSDGETSTNKVQFEQIVEPVLQEVLQKVQDVVNRNRTNVSKVYITGMGTLFTNIDTLFTEYFNMRAEIYKPKFVSEIGDIRNMAEVLETLPAISMAKHYLAGSKGGLDFLKSQTQAEGNFLEKIKKMIKPRKTVKKGPKKRFIIDFGKIQAVLAYPVAILIAYVIGYNVFTNLYVNRIDNYVDQYNAKISEYKTVIERVNSDKSMIAKNAGKYKNVNDKIDELFALVTNNEIGKYTTYNVASFTQKLAKIVPKDVTLKYIESDDKKHIKIGATSKEYPDIGYFVANLRLHPDILQNVAITSVQNGDVITVELEGDLP